MRKSVEWVINKYQKNLLVAAYSILKNKENAKDVVQDSFIKYYTLNKDYVDEEHIRAWLLRVTINRAKDVKKSFWHRFKTDDSISEKSNVTYVHNEEYGGLIDAVMELPEKYRVVIHLYYYEDLKIKEISSILRITETNVKVRLTRGREMLRIKLGEDWQND